MARGARLGKIWAEMGEEFFRDGAGVDLGEFFVSDRFECLMKVRIFASF